MTTIETTVTPESALARGGLLAIAVALSAMARQGGTLLADAQKAIYEAEQPADDAAAVAAVEAYAALAGKVLDAYEAAAALIERAHGGALRQLGTDIPIKAASLRLEGRIAAAMGTRWQREQAQVWEEIADMIDV